jgi:hypothetical protein
LSTDVDFASLVAKSSALRKENWNTQKNIG